MMTRTGWIAAAACVLGAGCTSARPFGLDAGDGAVSMREAGVACAPGPPSCEGATALGCGDDGLRVATACAGATPVCAPGRGCVACVPGGARCDPAHATTGAQRCADDGSAWVARAACDTGAGSACVDGACVDLCAQSALAPSYVGCEFWAVTLANSQSKCSGDFSFGVSIANDSSIGADIEIDGGGLLTTMSTHVAANDVDVVILPWVEVLAQRSMLPTSAFQVSGAYRVRSTSPVTVVQFNPIDAHHGSSLCATADASLLIPVAALGTRYRNLSYPGTGYAGSNEGALLAVVATQPGTTVELGLNSAIVPGAFVPTPDTMGRIEYTMDAGDVLELLAPRNADLTGSLIESSAPVAVFGGAEGATVPDNTIGAIDHLEEQLPPMTAWGRQVVVPIYRDRLSVPTVVRVVAANDGTVVTIDPPPRDWTGDVTLAAGGFVQTQLINDAVIAASKPVMVGTFMVGSQWSGRSFGDPSMSVLPPREQWRDRLRFYAPPGFDQNFVTVVGPSDAPPLLDGAAIGGTPSAIGTSGRSAWTASLTAGAHVVSSARAGDGCLAEVYGEGEAVSYAYSSGLDLRALAP